MALKQEQFVPFMIAVAIAFALWIVYTSFSYQSETSSKFEQEIAANDSLVVWDFPLIDLNNETQLTVSIDSLIRIEQKGALLIFVSSWSPKSIDVLSILENEYSNDIIIIVAVVKDTQEAAIDLKNQFSDTFYFVDGMAMYNEMRAPGLPTSIIYDKSLAFQGIFIGNKDLNELELLVKRAK